jgi:hypothetical protein
VRPHQSYAGWIVLGVILLGLAVIIPVIVMRHNDAVANGPQKLYVEVKDTCVNSPFHGTGTGSLLVTTPGNVILAQDSSLGANYGSGEGEAILFVPRNEPQYILSWSGFSRPVTLTHAEIVADNWQVELAPLSGC